MVKEEFAVVFHARLDNQARTSPLAKLWNEISRDMAIVEGHNGSVGQLVAQSFLQPPSS